MLFSKGKNNKKLGTKKPPKVSKCCETASGESRRSVVYDDSKRLTKRIIILSPCQNC